MGFDWSDGDYERMSATLEPAAAALVDYAGVTGGHHVVDVGCGTGNATIVAARIGARVTGIDPAEGLLEIARDRVAMIDADVAFAEGLAENLPAPDDVADVALSAFAVIFADDPSAAVAEMARVTRPNATVALTSWHTTGTISAIGDVLRRRIPATDVPDQRWGDDEWIRDLLEAAGLIGIQITDRPVEFRSGSPEQFLQELEDHHPAWRAVYRQLSDPDRGAAHDESLEILRAGNEDREPFLATSASALVRARVPGEEATSA